MNDQEESERVSRKATREALPGRAYLASAGFEKYTAYEIEAGGARVTARYGDLFYAERGRSESFWSRCVMEEPVKISFQSIGAAAAALKSIQRNWAAYFYTRFRRGALIESKLPYVSSKPRAFPYRVPGSPMGLWCLIDDKTIIASGKTSSPFPAGEIHFIEDHINPPSRAYLKLQEALTLAQYFFPYAPPPCETSRCLDAGASPGGWTWTLERLECAVVAVDRSPLADSLSDYQKLEFIKRDAFTLTPQSVGAIDWLCCDVVCYPQRLWRWIRAWLDSGLCANFICTLKMQGEPDWETIKAFAAVPHSKTVHLTANKHELTWICCVPPEETPTNAL